MFRGRTKKQSPATTAPLPLVDYSLPTASSDPMQVSLGRVQQLLEEAVDLIEQIKAQKDYNGREAG